MAGRCSAAAPNGCGRTRTRRSWRREVFSSPPGGRWPTRPSWRGRTCCGAGCSASRPACRDCRDCPPGSMTSTGKRWWPALPLGLLMCGPRWRSGRRFRCGSGWSGSWPRCPRRGRGCTTCSSRGVLGVLWVLGMLRVLWVLQVLRVRGVRGVRTAGARRGNWGCPLPEFSGCAARTGRRYCALSRSPRS